MLIRKLKRIHASCVYTVHLVWIKERDTAACAWTKVRASPALRRYTPLSIDFARVDLWYVIVPEGQTLPERMLDHWDGVRCCDDPARVNTIISKLWVPVEGDVIEFEPTTTTEGERCLEQKVFPHSMSWEALWEGVIEVAVDYNRWQYLDDWPRLNDQLTPGVYRKLRSAIPPTITLVAVIQKTAEKLERDMRNTPANTLRLSDLTAPERDDYLNYLQVYGPQSKAITDKLWRIVKSSSKTRHVENGEVWVSHDKYARAPAMSSERHRLLKSFLTKFRIYLQQFLPLLERQMGNLLALDVSDKVQVCYMSEIFVVFDHLRDAVDEVCGGDFKFSQAFKEAVAQESCRPLLQQCSNEYDRFKRAICSFRRKPRVKGLLKTLPQDASSTYRGFLSTVLTDSEDGVVLYLLNMDCDVVGVLPPLRSNAKQRASPQNVNEILKSLGNLSVGVPAPAAAAPKPKPKQRHASKAPPESPAAAGSSRLVPREDVPDKKARQAAEAVREAIREAIEYAQNIGGNWITVKSDTSRGSASRSTHRPAPGAVHMQQLLQKYYGPGLLKNKGPLDQYTSFHVRPQGAVAISRHVNDAKNRMLPHATISPSNLPNGYHVTMERGDRNHYYFRPDGTLRYATLYDDDVGGIVRRNRGVHIPADVKELSRRTKRLLDRHRR